MQFFMGNRFFQKKWRCLPNNEIGLPSSSSPYPSYMAKNWLIRIVSRQTQTNGLSLKKITVCSDKTAKSELLV